MVKRIFNRSDFHKINQNTVSMVLALLVLLMAGTTGLSAQDQAKEPIPIDHFDGWKEWPLHEPGDIEFDIPEAFGSLITWVDTRFGSGNVSRMRMDIIDDVYFKGKPAFWLQHTGSGNQGVSDGSGTSSLDATLFDRETFRVLFRVGAQAGSRSWAGTYDVWQHHPDKAVRVQVGEHGDVVSDSLKVENNNPFDFVMMPYMLAFMDLEQGQSFRFLNIGGRSNLKPRPVGIYVKGKTNVEDVHGREHEVWDVQLLNNNETLLINLYVVKEAPYFWGWKFSRIENGQVGTDWIYRDHHIIDKSR